jgi:hypothetical protein
VSKSKVDVDLSPLIKKWTGDSEGKIPGSHDGGDLEDLRELLNQSFGVKKTDIPLRMKLFSKTFLTSPYLHNSDSDVQEFKVLQGDIVKSALVSVPYPLYDFEESEATYIVNPNSCLIQKINQVVLTRLQPITKDMDDSQRTQLADALRFKSRRWFYLPALDIQPGACIGNIVDFDEIAIMRRADLENSTRLASLTQFGWHVFSQLLADFYSKPSGDDFNIRRDSGPTMLTFDSP